MTPIESSNLEAIGYDEETMTLEIDFISGETYTYHPFTLTGYQEFLACESKGKFFYRFIKNDRNITCTEIFK